MKDIEQLRSEAERVYAGAELLLEHSQVESALDRMATEITATLAEKNPVVLCLMIGAVITTGRLLNRLSFPLQLDYIHTSRYQDNTTGGRLQWIRKPGPELGGRTVLIVDDILDEGVTINAVIEECLSAGAGKVYTAVLLDKQIGRPRALPQADFTGLSIPDRYVFGYGMDYKGYLRNCDGIYAVRDQ